MGRAGLVPTSGMGLGWLKLRVGAWVSSGSACLATEDNIDLRINIGCRGQQMFKNHSLYNYMSKELNQSNAYDPHLTCLLAS